MELNTRGIVGYHQLLPGFLSGLEGEWLEVPGCPHLSSLPPILPESCPCGTHWKEAYGTTVSAPEHRELPLNRKQISTVFVYNKGGHEGWASFHWVKIRHQSLLENYFFSHRISLIIWRKFYLLETNYSNDSIISSSLSFSKWKKDKSTMERK